LKGAWGLGQAPCRPHPASAPPPKTAQKPPPLPKDKPITC
jgi:hypothetical protein